MKKIFLILLLVLGLVACAKQEVDNLSGKTFYDTTFELAKPTQVWLGKDKTFVLTINYFEGFDELTGNWSASNDVLTLNVTSPGADYSKVIFEVKDENTLILKTSLVGTADDAKFTTTKPVISNDNPENNNQGNSDPELNYDIYYNMSIMSGDGLPYIIIFNDGSFSLVENDSQNKLDVNGLYGKEGNMYIFSNFLAFNDRNGELVHNFEFKILDNGDIELQRDLCDSSKGDIFSTDLDTPKENNQKPEETKPETKPSSSGDIPCTGLTSLYNNYWCYAGVKDWDLEVKASPSNTTDKIYYKSNDESVVTVDSNGFATARGVGKTTIEVTCGNQKKTLGFEVKDKNSESSSSSSSETKESATVWKTKVDDVLDQYQPRVEFDGKGNFVFIENCYAGMGQYKGIYGKTDYGYSLKVNDASSMKGFAGDDVTEIIFKRVDDTTIKLKTDLCMSQNGMLFYLVP